MDAQAGDGRGSPLLCARRRGCAEGPWRVVGRSMRSRPALSTPWQFRCSLGYPHQGGRGLSARAAHPSSRPPRCPKSKCRDLPHGLLPTRRADNQVTGADLGVPSPASNCRHHLAIAGMVSASTRNPAKRSLQLFIGRCLRLMSHG